MKAKIIDIGRYVRVSQDVMMAKVSPRAQQVWTQIALNGSPEKPDVWVRQPTVAEQLNCSTDTIGRALRELMRSGLIIETGKLHQGRYKIYRLNWNPAKREEAKTPTANVRYNLPQNRDATIRTPASSPSAKAQDHVPQKCENLTKVLEEDNKNNSSREVEETPEERAWIIATIKTSLKEDRQKQLQEARQKHRCSQSEMHALQLQLESQDEPICKENHPIKWGYLRIMWADKMENMVA
ncbi:MAG TPA: hypothetical protein VI522_05255 [Gammaproteobacteria bacterium]|nr:hypothetical protein [Gammaproteobacteria bacterium]